MYCWKTLILIILFWLKKIETSPKAPKFKFDGSELLITKTTFAKVTPKIGPKKYFVIDFVLKTNPWTCKIKFLNGETIKWNFYEKKLLLSKLSLNYSPEPDTHTRDKLKIVLDFSNYANKNELEKHL